MKKVSMLQFRHHAEQIIERVRKGERLILTYRGKDVVRLEPLQDADSVAEDDPFYSLHKLADPQGQSLTNEEMDDVIYGS